MSERRLDALILLRVHQDLAYLSYTAKFCSRPMGLQRTLCIFNKRRFNFCVYVRNFHHSLSYYLVEPLVNRWKSRSRERGKIFCRACNRQPTWMDEERREERTLTLRANLRCI